MKRALYILILAVVVVSCKKEPLPDLPEETGPYYSIDGYKDNEFINLNVGQEGILISQGTTTNNGVLSYYGQIVSPEQDLFIKIEVTRPEKPMTASGLQAIHDGNIGYLVHQPGCLSPSFGSNILQQNFVLIKNASGQFEPITQIEFEEYGMYDLTMKLTDVGQNSFVIPIQYGYKPMELDPGFTTGPDGDSVIFEANHPDGTHEWYVDGALVNSTDALFKHQMSIGVHTIEHKLIDEYDNEASHFTLVRITDFVLDWQMTLGGCSAPVYNSNFGKVTISVLTDGKEYKSDRSMANLQNNFIVNDISYVGDGNGNPVRAVFDFSFDAMLVDEYGTDSLSLEGMTGTFNVGLQ